MALFLSVCSYWRAVNMEMMNATLEVLDEVERRTRVNSGVLLGEASYEKLRPR